MANVNTLDDECNNACRDLPDGYEITIFLENGAGWIVLIDPDGEVVPLELADMTLAQQVSLAVAMAHDDARLSSGKTGGEK